MTMIGGKPDWIGPFQMPDLGGAVVMPPPAPAQEKPKVNWIGILADALSAAAGQAPAYRQRLERERAEQSAFERGEQQYRRRLADQRAEKQWEWENAPKSPYRWESNDGSLMEMGPDGNARLVYQDPTPKEKWVFDPVRGYVNINALSPSVPTAPVGKLTPLGGQPAPPAGTFRPYYP
jgi:hypothetical protein